MARNGFAMFKVGDIVKNTHPAYYEKWGIGIILEVSKLLIRVHFFKPVERYRKNATCDPAKLEKIC